MNRLFTTHYHEPHEPRRMEVEECLRLNQGYFHEVTVLSENCPRPEWFHGKWFDCEHRQRYGDVLALAANADASDLVVIANSDIVVQSVALMQIEESLEPNECYALTRWDVDANGNKHLFDQVHSQDTWVFRGPPKTNIRGDFYLGVPGCDNRFAHELASAGYKVLNPSRSIQTYHLHLSGYRTSNTPENRVPLPYLYVSPHRLGQRPIYRRPTRPIRRASQFRHLEPPTAQPAGSE